MLVYEKKVTETIDGVATEVRQLFGTVNDIPSDSDNQLVYKDADGDAVTPSLDYKYLDNGSGGITMVETDGTEIFLGVNIKKTDNSLVNIIPGGSYEPADKVLKSIRFKKKPTKLTYTAGDTLDLTGTVIQATWETGEKSDVALDDGDLTFSPLSGATLTVDDTTITATYKFPHTGTQVTKEATCTITVNAAE